MRSKEEIMHRFSKLVEHRTFLLKECEKIVKEEEEEKIIYSNHARHYKQEIANVTYQIKELEWVLENKK